MVRMAIRSEAPIVPVGLSGTGLAFPPEAYPRLEKLPIAKPEKITVKFGKPIYFKEYYGKEPDRETLRKLTNQVMESISALVDHSRGYVPIELPVRGIEKYKNLGVLLLHGFTSSLKTVDGFVPYLKKRKISFRMPILRGHGTNPKDLENVTSQDWYDDAEKSLLDLAGEVDKVIVIGLSMGGLVALELGIRHSDRIAAVVGVAPALKFKDPLSGLSPLMSKIVKYWPSPNAYNDKECAKTNKNYPKFPTKAFVSLLNYSKRVEELLPRLKVPIMLLQSKKDQIVSPRAARIIYDNIGALHKKIVWFEKSGHEMMQDLEKKAVFKEIDNYIAQFQTEESKQEPRLQAI
jgi:carboxylesterase